MKRIVEIPEWWDEMKPKDYHYLLKLIFRMINQHTITPEDLLRKFANHLIGSPFYIRPKKRFLHLNLINDIANLLDWIFRKEEDIVFNFDTTINLIPQIGKLQGPKSHGSDFRFGEYRHACDFYNRYTLTHEIQYLDALVGILYRKPSKNNESQTFNGDYRETFNKHHIGKYADRVKQTPEYIKWGVYLWFGYFCEYLMTGPFVIDGYEVSFASIFSRQTDQFSKKDESLGMTSVLFSLAESHIFGDIKETDNAFLFDVMMKLLNDKHQIDKLKKRK